MKHLYEQVVEFIGWVWDWVTFNSFLEELKSRGTDFWSDED